MSLVYKLPKLSEATEFKLVDPFFRSDRGVEEDGIHVFSKMEFMSLSCPITNAPNAHRFYKYCTTTNCETVLYCSYYTFVKIMKNIQDMKCQRCGLLKVLLMIFGKMNWLYLFSENILSNHMHFQCIFITQKKLNIKTLSYNTSEATE